MSGLDKNILLYPARILCLLPFVYVVVAMFFLPDGDSHINWLLIPAMVISLCYRFKISYWRIGRAQLFISPLVVYTLVLGISYLVQGGFASAVRPFFYSMIFLYLSEPLLPSLDRIRYLFIIAGFQLAIMTFYLHELSGIWRVGGFTNPIFWGIYAFCTALLCLYFAETAKVKWVKVLFWLSALLSAYAVVLSGTRGVWLASAPILVIYLIFIIKNARYPYRLIVGLGIALGIVVFLGFGPLNARIQDALSNTHKYYSYVTSTRSTEGQAPDAVFNTSVGLRLAMWRFSLSAFRESPIWGLGRNGAEEAKKRYVEEGRSPPQLMKYQKGHVHNQYLQELVMRGLIGLSALLALIFVPIIEGWRRLRMNYWSGYAIISLSLAFAVFSLTESAFKHPYKSYVFIFYMSILFFISGSEET